MGLVRASIFAAFAAICLCLLPSSASAQGVTAYMKVTVNGTELQGGAVTKAHNGTIRLSKVSQAVSTLQDAAAGVARGRRQHRPLAVSFEIDRTAPLLFKALVNNENVAAEITFWAANARDGVETKLYTIEVKNGRAANFVTRLEGTQLLVDFEMTFSSIEVTYENGGIVATDDIAAAR